MVLSTFNGIISIMIIPKEIIRSKRKSIALVVNSDGELIVRAPYYASKDAIIGFIHEKQNWLERKCRAVKEANSKFQPITMAEGDIVKFCGEDYTINLCAIDDIVLFGMYIKIPLACTREQFKIWLKRKALALMKKRTTYYATLMGALPCEVKVSEARTRWGSCSFRNNINFSWRLVMCPLEVMDYVIVHELCHIKNKSHNRAFWASVAEVLPDYGQQEKWLKNNRKLMDIL